MKHTIHRFVSVLVLVFVVTTAVVCCHAQEAPSPLNPEYEKLVELLGDSSFQVRERAHQALSEIGLSARRELAAGLRSPDLEIRSRVRRIYVDLMYEDFEQKLQRFIDD